MKFETDTNNYHIYINNDGNYKRTKSKKLVKTMVKGLLEAVKHPKYNIEVSDEDSHRLLEIYRMFETIHLDTNENELDMRESLAKKYRNDFTSKEEYLKNYYVSIDYKVTDVDLAYQLLASV